LRAEHLGSIRVVGEPARMLLYSERNLAEAVIARVAGGNMASTNASGGLSWVSNAPEFVDISLR
jgi:hypothetical protein